MSVEFIGFVGFQHSSEIHPATGPVLDAAYVETLARAHEAGDFDRALIAFHSVSADSIIVAAHAAAAASRSTSSPAAPTRNWPRTATI